MALPNAVWDGQKIVTVVSRLTGLANDSTSRAACLDYINLGLWEISLESRWDWNVLTAANITVAGTGEDTYNLPTGTGEVYDDIYDVRLVGPAERTLFPADLREWDRFQQGEQGAAASATHYVLFGTQRGGTIRLVPAHGSADTLRLRYYARQATISDSTASSLAMADKYMPLVIFKAAENIAGWKTPERVAYWNAKFNKCLSRAQEVDRVKDDQIPTLVPHLDHGRTRLDAQNLNDLDIYPR